MSWTKEGALLHYKEEGFLPESLIRGLSEREVASLHEELGIPLTRKDSLALKHLIPPTQKATMLDSLINRGLATRVDKFHELAGIPEEKPLTASDRLKEKRALIELEKLAEQPKTGLVSKGIEFTGQLEEIRKRMEAQLPKLPKEALSTEEKARGILSEIEAREQGKEVPKTGFLAGIRDLLGRREGVSEEEEAELELDKIKARGQGEAVPLGRPVFEKGGPGREFHQTRAGAIKDSLAIINRAIERNLKTDFYGLIDSFPVAEQAWDEFNAVCKRAGGVNNRQAIRSAADLIYKKYGSRINVGEFRSPQEFINTVRDILYAEFGAER